MQRAEFTQTDLTAARATTDGTRPKNRLLGALPEDDFHRLKPHLEKVPARHRQRLFGPGDRIEYVYFPNGGMCSIATVLPDGAVIEAATIGDEGVVGIEAFFCQDPIAPGENLVQVPDASLERLSVAVFRREIEAQAALSILVGRYAQVVVAMMMQGSACNAHHQVQERCAKWLLVTHDRLHQPREFRLSQEFLAMMIGTTRPTVTTVAGAFQRAGLIQYSYGRIRVEDRKGLEAAACPCYAVIRSYFDRLEWAD